MGRNRNTCGVIRVRVFHPATSPNPIVYFNQEVLHLSIEKYTT